MWSYFSNYWTSAEQLAWKQTAMPIVCGLSLAINVVALLTYYVFPRMREFPRSVIIWAAYYNIIFDCYMIWKWAPGSALSSAWSAHMVPGSNACKGGLFFDNFTMSGGIACNTLLTFTIFFALKFNGAKFSRWVHWFYIAFVTMYPFCIGLVACIGFMEMTDTGPGTSCQITSEKLNMAIKLPGFVLLALQMVFLGLSISHMRKVMKSVSSVTGPSFPMRYLVIRFSALYVSQIFNLLPTQIYVIAPRYVTHIAIFVRFVFVSHAIGGATDAIVLIMGNTDFVAWVKRKMPFYVKTKESPSSSILTNDNTPPEKLSVELVGPSEILQSV